MDMVNQGFPSWIKRFRRVAPLLSPKASGTKVELELTGTPEPDLKT
jgi:hypothetical protein